MLSDAPLSTAPLSSVFTQAEVFPDSFRVWDDSTALYDVLDESEGLPDGQ
jgi:hypothetical protein